MSWERDELLSWLDRLPLPVAVLDGPEHVVRFLNRAVRELLDARPAQGLPFRDVFPELADTALHAALDTTFGSAQALVVPWSSDGQGEAASAWDVRLDPLMDQERQVTGILVAAKPVGAEPALREQLEFMFEEVRVLTSELNRQAWMTDSDGA